MVLKLQVISTSSIQLQPQSFKNILANKPLLEFINRQNNFTTILSSSFLLVNHELVKILAWVVLSDLHVSNDCPKSKAVFQKLEGK